MIVKSYWSRRNVTSLNLKGQQIFSTLSQSSTNVTLWTLMLADFQILGPEILLLDHGIAI